MTGYHGPGGPGGGSGLIDILDRVLDKGLVVAGDIRVSLANVELLTIRIRLLVCSIDKAEQIGLNWWRYDQSLVKPILDTPELVPAPDTIARLEARIAELEAQLDVQRRSTPVTQRSTQRSTPSTQRSTRRR
ncbi:MAG TPA: gas vesicle protein [Chloroflexota bacterium]|nr:gas vesicle protein [Chloroflexota bacterium]